MYMPISKYMNIDLTKPQVIPSNVSSCDGDDVDH